MGKVNEEKQTCSAEPRENSVKSRNPGRKKGEKSKYVQRNHCSRRVAAAERVASFDKYFESRVFLLVFCFVRVSSQQLGEARRAWKAHCFLSRGGFCGHTNTCSFTRRGNCAREVRKCSRPRVCFAQSGRARSSPRARPRFFSRGCGCMAGALCWEAHASLLFFVSFLLSLWPGCGGIHVS